MKKRLLNFGDLLTEGIYAIQHIESKQKKKSVQEIEEELSKAINRKSTSIEWFRKGNIPTAQFEVEELARTIYTRGHLDLEWLEYFLKSAKHPNWFSLRDELNTSSTKHPQVSNETLYKRIRANLVKHIYLDGTVVTIHDIDIRATSITPLTSIRHRIINSTNNIKEFRLDLNATNREDEGNISARIATKNDNIYTWLIEFSPPLLRGKSAHYSYTTYSKDSYSLTNEEIYKQYLSGTRSKNFESWGITITAPTDEIRMKVAFSPK